MLPTDCLAVKLVRLGGERRAFVRMGWVGFISMVALGAMSFFFDPILIMKIADLTVMCGAASNVSKRRFML